MDKQKFVNYLHNEVKRGNEYIEKLKDSKYLHDVEFVNDVRFQQRYLFLLLDMINMGMFD